MRPSIEVCLAGDAGSPEMPAIRAVLENDPQVRIRSCSAEQFADVTLKGEDTADLIVVLVSWPGQFSRETVERCLAEAPLTRFVACLGRWCESLGRNSTIWPDALRVSARAAGSRIRHELEVIRGHSVALPSTASRDEAFLYDHADRDSLPADDRTTCPVETTIQVISDDRSWRETTGLLLSDAGYVLSGQDADILIIDLEPYSMERIETCRRLQCAYPKARLLGVGNWLPDDLLEDPRRFGVDRIVARLAPFSELEHAIGVMPAESGSHGS